MKEKKYVYYHNKKSGTTYVIQNFSYWDKEKKQPRSKRKYIGTLNKENGEIIPSKGRGYKKEHPKPDLSPYHITNRSFYGATYLLDAISEKLGISDDLKKCFPDKYKHILSLAYFMASEDHRSLYRFEKWSELHHHPYGENIPINMFDELFIAISDKKKTAFLKLFEKRQQENDDWDFDVTPEKIIDNEDSTSQNILKGKQFVHFITCIFTSYIESKLTDKNYHKNYAVAEVLDKLDLIERFEHNSKIHITELTDIQKKIYQDLQIPTPSA